jgi:hypothetical protein
MKKARFALKLLRHGAVLCARVRRLVEALFRVRACARVTRILVPDLEPCIVRSYSRAAA